MRVLWDRFYYAAALVLLLNVIVVLILELAAPKILSALLTEMSWIVSIELAVAFLFAPTLRSIRAFDLLNPLTLIGDVRVGTDGIQFVLLRLFVVATVRFENIEAVEKQWKWYSRLSAYRFVYRLGPTYLINKKTAWFSKYVVVSPGDPEQFEASLRRNGVLIRG